MTCWMIRLGKRRKKESSIEDEGFQTMRTIAPWTSCHTSWNPPSETLALGIDEVHVWRARLDQEPSRVQSLLSTLSTDERERADRFHFQRDREHFIIARGALRAILGRYLQRDATRVRFYYGPHGKPALANESEDNAFRFNISHSHERALYAITRGREIGVDLERVRPILNVEEIAQRFFSQRETAALRALPPETRTRAFFACWTRKEAYIKARAEGLSFPLDKFDVSLAPGEPAALLSAPEDPQEASRWTLLELEPGPGYVAALAVEGNGWRLACWDWEC